MSMVRVMVSVRIRVKFNFGVRVGIRLPDVERVELCRVPDV